MCCRLAAGLLQALAFQHLAVHAAGVVREVALLQQVPHERAVRSVVLDDEDLRALLIQMQPQFRTLVVVCPQSQVFLGPPEVAARIQLSKEAMPWRMANFTRPAMLRISSLRMMRLR